MFKVILGSLIAAVVAATPAYEAPEPSPMACTSVTSQRVVKIAGQTAGYPTECALPVCRVMNWKAQKTHLEGFMGIPGSYITVLDWRYQVQLGAVPPNACPADVVAGPWTAP
jgi:hypothetical protein